MPPQIEAQIVELKSEFSNYRRQQKSSFAHGVAQGLILAALISRKSGCDIAEDEQFQEIFDFLIAHTPPEKEREDTREPAVSDRDQLLIDFKELLRRSIAGHLRIYKNTYDKSLKADELVNKYLLTVVAIGNRESLDEAINDIRILRSITGGGCVDRTSVKEEVEYSYETFRIEIAAVGHFNELSKRNNFEMKDIWNFLRANVPISHGHEDEELRILDERYR